MSSDLTVVIPAYNASRYIVSALGSIKNQTLQPDKVILVENGSSDETRDVCRDWMDSNTLNVELVTLNFGNVSNARNVGFSLAATDLVAMLDSDDFYEVSFLEKAVKILNEHPDIDLFFGDRMLFNQKNGAPRSGFSGSRINSASQQAIQTNVFRFTDGLVEALAWGNFISPSGSVCRRAAAYSAGLFNPRLRSSEDRDFFMRMAAQGQVAYTRDIAAWYRIHDDSTTSNTNRLNLRKNELRCISSILVDSDKVVLSAGQKRVLSRVCRYCARRIMALSAEQGFISLWSTWAWLRQAQPIKPANLMFFGIRRSAVNVVKLVVLRRKDLG